MASKGWSTPNTKLRKRGNGYQLEIDVNVFRERLQYAQCCLDTQIAHDILPYIPGHDLQNEVNTLNQTQIGTGELYLYPADHDYAHYLYEGEKYVDEITGKSAFFTPEYGFWSRPGVSKVPSGEMLEFHKPFYTSHWGEVAYDNHAEKWFKVAQRALNK